MGMRLRGSWIKERAVHLVLTWKAQVLWIICKLRDFRTNWFFGFLPVHKNHTKFQFDRESEGHRESLSTQLKSALTMVDSEELARSIAKEQISNLEQEKTMIKLEVKEKGTQISRLKELNQLLTDNLDRGTSEKNELNSKIKSLQEELKSLKKKLDSERTLRIQAADKLAELMHRKDRELRMQRVDRSCNCWHSSDDF
ncbi:hypothetical protein ACROYT_G009014 [Oculina patagonica]